MATLHKGDNYDDDDDNKPGKISIRHRLLWHQLTDQAAQQLMGNIPSA